jgi:hypothetical protein
VKKALLTGGLLLTKKVERTDVKTTTTDEAFILLEQPGFVAGLPKTAADPLDVALALVSLAHRQKALTLLK